MPAPGVAYFDLDRTVVAVNSAALWVRRELREGRIGRVDALRAAGWFLAYRAGLPGMERAIRRAVATLEGVPAEELRLRLERFWEEEVCPAVRPGAREALARHRAAGEPCVLLTASSCPLAERAAADLGMDGTLCTRLETREGRLTGRVEEPPCFGPGKVVLAERDAASRGVRLEDCAFYTDSASDIPLLERVGRPVAVDPDPRLAREARRRGWPVVRWGEPLQMPS